MAWAAREAVAKAIVPTGVFGLPLADMGIRVRDGEARLDGGSRFEAILAERGIEHVHLETGQVGSCAWVVAVAQGQPRGRGFQIGWSIRRSDGDPSRRARQAVEEIMAAGQAWVGRTSILGGRGMPPRLVQDGHDGDLPVSLSHDGGYAGGVAAWPVGVDP